MFKYIFPLYYTYKTRLKTKLEKVTYIFTYIIPVLLIVIMGLKNRLILISFSGGILSIFLCMSIYEIGYIVNDTISIKNEKEPTLRLDEKEIKKIQKEIKKIIFLKIVVSLIFYKVLILFFTIGIYKYLYVLVAISAVFFVHNSFRNNKITYITFFLLSTLRFFTPCYILINDSKFLKIFFVTIIFLFSLIRNIEEIGHKKYFVGNLNIYEIRHSFRVIYYGIFLLITIFLSTITKKYFIENIEYLLWYLFIYRFIVYSAIKIKKQ